MSWYWGCCWLNINYIQLLVNWLSFEIYLLIICLSDHTVIIEEDGDT